ncbi:MAG: hypothetical protein AAF845_16355 [Bacteroidota bacterium]
MPSYLHDIILLYLTVLDDRGGGAPAEHNLMLELAHRWAPDAERSDIEAVARTASLALRGGLRGGIDLLTKSLCDQLPAGRCRELLSDLGALARADGHLTQHEAETISLVRSAFARRHYGSGAHASA